MTATLTRWTMSSLSEPSIRSQPVCSRCGTHSDGRARRAARSSFLPLVWQINIDMVHYDILWSLWNSWATGQHGTKSSTMSKWLASFTKTTGYSGSSWIMLYRCVPLNHCSKVAVACRSIRFCSQPLSTDILAPEGSGCFRLNHLRRIRNDTPNAPMCWIYEISRAALIDM